MHCSNPSEIPWFDILKATHHDPCLGEVSYNSAINACAKSGEWQSAMILLQVTPAGEGGWLGLKGWVARLQKSWNW